MKTKLLLMLLAIAFVAGAAQANMLKNPGFEAGVYARKNVPDNWAVYESTFTSGWTWLSTGGIGGGKCVKMMSNLDTAAYYSSAFIGQYVPATVGEEYTFSVWTKSPTQGKAVYPYAYYTWFDSGGGSVAYATMYPDISVVGNTWTEVSFGSLVAPEGAVTLAYWLTGYSGNADANGILYDDASIAYDPNSPDVYAGADMITWSGQEVQLLDASVINNDSKDPQGTLSYLWSADPDYGADITAGGDTLTPTVQVDCIIPSGPATIANHSFENGLENWDTLTGEGHDTWNGVGEPGSTIYITPTDGRMCAYVDGVSDGLGKLSQVLVNTLAANTDYTLSVDVVNDGYYEEDVEYRVQLYAGESLLAQDNDGQALDTYGEWKTSTVNFSTGDDHAALGEQLEIRLVAKTGTARMNFDNVVLTANPPFGAYVPDILPVTLTLTATLPGSDPGEDTMTFDVYPDACAAKLAAGLRETTDLVGDDCITNLPDLAEWVKTWPDDNAFTEPKVKEGQVQATEYNGEFQCYKPGTNYTVTANFPGSSYAKDVGDNVPVTSGNADYSDGTSGGFIDCPGWVKIRGNCDLLNNGVDGSTGLNAFASWGGDTNVESAESLGGIVFGNYTLSAVVSGGVAGGPLALYLTADGVEIPASSSVHPPAGSSVGDWQEISSTYNSNDIMAYIGKAMTIVVGVRTENDIGGRCVFDNITLDVPAGFQFGTGFRFNPSPENDAYVKPDSELELSWTNMDPNAPGDPVWVDVWFGTDPNDYNDFNKIVDAVEDANSVTVDANDLGTYYWQVNSYIYGDPAEVDYDIKGTDPNKYPVIEAAMWRFIVATDVPVSVEAGNDVITWSGQAVQLESTIDDDGESELTIGWTADPNAGEGFTVDLSDPSAEDPDPTVTITKVPYSTARIANAGFEDPVLGDDLYGGSHPGWGWFDNDDYCGTWNPAASDYPDEAPEGESIGWVNPGGAVNDNGTPTDPNDDFWDLWPGGLAQILPETFAAETTYTLTVEVGNTAGYDWGGYGVQIVAGGTGNAPGEITGGTVLAEDANSLSIAEGTFATSTVVYTYNPAHADLVGEQLQIRLLSLGGASVDEEADFDNVQLTADPPFPAPTGILTVTLTLSVSDAVSSDDDTMKIDVHDTACLAAISEGEEYDAGDFDVDCDTDLEDYATIAEEWLVYKELTTSIVKP